ncbi:hypothetical protein [Brevundimonas sp.]|jgi:hypothetical protein|uniref:hypothetical protein n=1 Tax=Brevundimonas sp. TaxID=1871086 RepID=UPI002E1294F4|nr:hypothetical protein [Brevundimonas sp.]
MKSGFYSLFQAGGDQDPDDGEAYGLAILAHFKDGRFVGVDQGGCKVSGEYEFDSDDRVAMRLIYDFKAGSQMPDGSTLVADQRLEADLLLAPGAAEGEPQPIDIGLGPMFIRLNWLAGPV